MTEPDLFRHRAVLLGRWKDLLECLLEGQYDMAVSVTAEDDSSTVAASETTLSAAEGLMDDETGQVEEFVVASVDFDQLGVTAKDLASLEPLLEESTAYGHLLGAALVAAKAREFLRFTTAFAPATWQRLAAANQGVPFGLVGDNTGGTLQFLLPPSGIAHSLGSEMRLAAADGAGSGQ